MPYALLSLGVMVALMVSGLVPNVLAGLIAVLLMGFFGCLSLRSAYRAIQLPVLVLIVGMMPFATALEKTGGVELAVNGLVYTVGYAGPMVVLASVFAITSLTALFISNTATAVLMAPVALGLAKALSVSPQPLLMTVAIACSAVFSSPLSAPLNALIMEPGQYRFIHFIKFGLPMTLMALVVTVLLVPWLMPL
jgi:di/tricarboxylate transporter